MYIKIQDYLSQIGGIVSLALNIFPHFIYLISIGRRDEKLLNVLIEFRNDRIHANSIKSIKSLKTINNLPLNNKLSIHESNIKKVMSNSNNENSNDPAEKSAGLTETQKAASANLDQILQSKIRKGENLS